MIGGVRTWVALGAILVAGSAGFPQARGSASHRQTLRAVQAPPPKPAPAPPDLSKFWMVPAHSAAPAAAATSAQAGFVKAVKLIGEGRCADALPLLTVPALRIGLLADYATYYAGLAHLRLNEPVKARESFAALRARRPAGFLAEAAPLGEADAEEALNNHGAAARLFAEALARNPAAPDDVLFQLGRSAQSAGDLARAVDSFSRLYGEFPLSDLAPSAEDALRKLPDWPPLSAGSTRYRLEFARAERLYAARRFKDAQKAFDAIRRVASGDEAELVALRLAECDYGLKRYAAARTRLKPLLDSKTRGDEAGFVFLCATRDVGERNEYRRLAREFMAAFEASPFAEDTLNGLANSYIVAEEDEQADQTFRELLARYPNGKYSERASWKVGWWAYRHGRYDEAARQFESAAATFPHSDYRPAFLYWCARAYERAGNREAADAAALAAVEAYGSSYYGRLAARRLGDRAPALPAELPPAIAAAAAGAQPPPTQPLITLLLSLELYDEAQDELLYVQRTSGSSPLIDATLAWVYNRKSDYRRGIIAMRRAYPQFLSAGGELLPAELRRVIFPLDFWPLIQKYAAARQLDPYLISALMAQESSFDPAIKSAANAIGLMQILPSTGRRYARKLGIRRYSTSMLTRPEINIQIGTAYFADLMQAFGRVEFALCGYNAGETRIAKWMAERTGLDEDEFVDDVPFPETQNYLKRILGPAEDYRRLYPDGPPPAAVQPPKSPAPASAQKAATPKPQPKAPVKKAPVKK